MKIRLIHALLALTISCVASAEEIAPTTDVSRGDSSKDNAERLPICRCTCHKAAEGGGDHPGFSGEIWFRATADTKCEVNNDAECGYSGKPIPFAGGKTKNCRKALVTQYPH